MSLKPIKLFSHASGPNPWKVAIVLEELGLPYETEFMDFSVLHTPVYEKYNPNGRVPAIVDPNNSDLVLWESGAIIEYLVETYDKEHKLSFADKSADSYKTKQWLYFQVSGQGPYFGQAAWFSFFHAEKIPSARDRYMKEVHRVTAVLNSALKGKESLVGDKITYADLAFVPWYNTATRLDTEGTGYWDEMCKNNPDFKRWLDSMNARPAVIKIFKEKAEKATH